MVNHLLIQNNSKLYLLVEYPDRYHMILVNRRLDNETEERILSSVCNEVFLDDMGLTRQTIMKDDLRGVAVGGCRAGDAVVLYRGKEKLKCVLSDDYTNAYIDAMFVGIERFQAPKSISSKKNNADWRKERQDESMMHLMGVIGIFLNIAGVASCIITVIWGGQEPLCILLSLAVSLAATVMYLAFPQYYSIMGSKGYKKAGYSATVTHLEFGITGPLLAVSLASISAFTILDWTTVLISMAIISIAVLILLYRFSRELREHLDLFLGVALLVVFVSLGVVEQVNHLMDFSSEPPRTYVVTETEHNRSRKGRDSFYCTVELEDGTEAELPITRAEYDQLQAGDQVLVYVGTGALGIEYAYFVEIIG